MDTKDFATDKFRYAWILGAVTFFGGLLIIAVVIFPLYQSAASATKQATEKRAELEALKAKKVVLDGLKDKEDELKRYAQTVSSALPDSKDVGPLFIQLNQLAVSNGGTLKSVSGSGGNSVSTNSNKTETGFSGIQKYTYSVPVAFGTYENMKSFISSTKNALRLLSITDISINPSSTGSMDVNMTIITYARG